VIRDVVLVHRDETLRIGKGERADEHAADDGEDRTIRPDT